MSNFPPTALQNRQENGMLSEAERRLLMARRQAIIIELGALEEYLGIERSILPRHMRKQSPHHDPDPPRGD